MQEEHLLTPTNAKQRVDWINKQMEIRPRSKHWKNTAHYDEFHFGLGLEETHRIKRPKGKKYRYTPENVYRKKSTRKDEKIKACGDDDPFKTFSVFIVVGYNYRRYI